MEARKRKHSQVQKMVSQSCSVISLPTDLMIHIMGCIASSSFADLFTSKLCCKEFMAATESDYIFGRVSIPEDKFPVVQWRADDKARCFLRRCMENGNPEALFREGMMDYFSRGKVERGLENLKAAVEKGHVEASYVYGIILLCSGGKSNKKLGLKLLNDVKISSQSSSSSSSSTVGDCRKRAKSIIRQMWINNRLQSHQEDQDSYNLHPHGQSEMATSAVGGWPQDDDVIDVMECEACTWAREAAKFCNIVQGHA